MSDYKGEGMGSEYEAAEPIPFMQCETTRWTFGKHWIEIEQSDIGFIVDSDLLTEEIGFSETDDLLKWLEDEELIAVLSAIRAEGESDE